MIIFTFRSINHLGTLFIIIINILAVKSSEVDLSCRINRGPICFVKTSITEANTTIGKSSDDLSKFTILHFKDTTVNFLPNGINQRFLNLQTLKVTKSSLKAIENFNFKGLDQLTEIDFESNEISELAVDVFEFLVNLNKINLNFNSLKILPSKVFSKNTNLTYISLSNNNIEKLNDRTFENLRNLETLNLDKNDIDKLEEETFTGLSSLKTLDLSNNKIKYVYSGTFDDCPKLTTLHIQDNSLQYVESDIFKNNKKLAITIDNFRRNSCIDESFSDLNDALKKCDKIDDFVLKRILNILKKYSEKLTSYDIQIKPNESTTSDQNVNVPYSSKMESSAAEQNNLQNDESVSIVTPTSAKSSSLYNVACYFDHYVYSVGGLEFGNFFACSVNGQKILSCGKTLGEVSEGPTGKNVDGLVFDNSYYVNFPRKVFDKFTNLKYLSISNSGFGNFVANFCELSIDFEYVLITESYLGDTIIIGNCLSLKHLKIENSDIKEIHAEKPVASLTDLVLKSNKIEKISKEFFSKFKNLKNVQLSGNQITHLDGDAFDENSFLLIVNLSQNPIKTIGSGILDSCAKNLILFDFTNIVCTNESDDKLNLIGGKSEIGKLKNILNKYCAA